MDIILSLAVPAYNMEKYLPRCLDSILLAEANVAYEVIVINDGSKDETLSIARKYEDRYRGVVKVIDKPNGGWGSAINVAIREAQGKYFKILDSDDWFDTVSFAQFLKLASEVDVDLLASSFSYEYDSQPSKYDIYSEDICGKVTSFEDYLIENNYVKHIPMATIAFKTSILQENNITICDRFYADVDYNLTPLIFVKTVYFSPIVLYKYYIGREGQSTSIAGYNAHIDDFLNVCKKLVTFYNANAESMSDVHKRMYLNDAKNVVRFAYYLLMSPVFSGAKAESKGKLIELDSFIKHNSRELYAAMNKIKIKKFIPYIMIYRKTGINVLKLRKK